MNIIPIITDRVDMNPKESILEWIEKSLMKNQQEVMENDVLVLSSKIVSFFERRVVKLSEVEVSEESKKSIAGQDCGPELVQLVLQEADEIVADTKWVMLTRNKGVYSANAGIDKRNVPKGHAVLWPKDPFESAKTIHEAIKNKMNIKNIAVVIIDSLCIPGRRGTIAVAIGYAGIEGYLSLEGEEDLFGQTFRYAGLNVVDSFATAANVVMGESTEMSPIVLIRGAKWTSQKNTKNDEMIIPPSEDMFPLR